MRLSIKALSFAFSLLYGGIVLVVGLLNLIWPTYGAIYLQFQESIHPGYHFGGGFGSVIIETLYGLLCGAVFGAVFGWLYNRFIPKASA